MCVCGSVCVVVCMCGCVWGGVLKVDAHFSFFYFKIDIFTCEHDPGFVMISSPLVVQLYQNITRVYKEIPKYSLS